MNTDTLEIMAFDRDQERKKKINCKWCGMGHAPRSDGNHWIVKSIIPAKIDIKECAYHKAGTVSPIQHKMPIG